MLLDPAIFTIPYLSQAPGTIHLLGVRWIHGLKVSDSSIAKYDAEYEPWLPGMETDATTVASKMTGTHHDFMGPRVASDLQLHIASSLTVHAEAA